MHPPLLGPPEDPVHLQANSVSASEHTFFGFFIFYFCSSVNYLHKRHCCSFVTQGLPPLAASLQEGQKL